MFNKKIVSAFVVAALSMSPAVLAQNEDLTAFGDTAQIALPVFAAGFALYQGDTDGFIQAAEGALYTAILTHTLKFSIDAERPDGSDNNSFPSGHTSAAMQGAAFLTMRYGWEIGLPAYAVASVVGYSRIDANKHNWPDVAASVVLATMTQYMVSKAGWSITNYSINPTYNDDLVGIAFNGNF